MTPGKHRTRRLTYESKRGTRIQTSPHNNPPFRKDPSQTPSARKKARLDLKTGLILGLRRGKGQDDLDSVRGVSTMQRSLPFDVELTSHLLSLSAILDDPSAAGFFEGEPDAVFGGHGPTIGHDGGRFVAHPIG